MSNVKRYTILFSMSQKQNISHDSIHYVTRDLSDLLEIIFFKFPQLGLQ